MNSGVSALQRSVTTAFYVEHSVLILLFATCFFGFLSASEHLAMASFFTSSPFGLVLPVSFWMLVSLRIGGFNRQITSRPEYQFLWLLRRLPYPALFSKYVRVVAMQLVPVNGYGIFLLAIANRNGNELMVSLLVVILTCMNCAVTHFSIQPFIRDTTPSALTFPVAWYLRKRPLPQVFFFPLWLIRSTGIVYLIYLVISFLIVAAVSHLYTIENYDERFYALAAWAAAAVMFQFELARIRYDYRAFVLPRHLPISSAKHFFTKVGSTALVLAPLIVAFVRQQPAQVNSWHCLEIILLFIALPVFWHTLLLLQAIPVQALLPNVLFSGLVIFILIVGKINLTLLAAILLVLAFLIFRARQNRYEWDPGQELH